MEIVGAVHLWCPACLDVSEHAVLDVEPDVAVCNVCGGRQRLAASDEGPRREEVEERGRGSAERGWA